MARDYPTKLPSCGAGYYYRDSIIYRTYLGRNSTFVVYRAKQQFYDHGHEQTDGKLAGNDLPVCDEPIHIVAGASMGWRTDYHDLYFDC